MKNTIDFVGNYIEDSLSKIKGFDRNWITMISSKPLLFEDVDYMRVKNNVEDTITDEELEAYKRGDLRELYATFENMLMCNIQYFDRIMRFCTLNMFGYIRVDDQKTSQHMKKVVLNFSMTPTQIWCGALCGQFSTKWELEYGWGVKLYKGGGLELNYNTLNNFKNFNIFVKYSSYICESSGFRNTLLVDKTNNKRLSNICNKFTNNSAITSTEQLETIINYDEYVNDNVRKLYESLDRCLSSIYNGDKSQYAIYIYSNEFWIHTSRFSMRVQRNEDGKLTKDYISNSYECFAAEQYLIKSTKQQIEWSKNVTPIQYEYDKNVLRMILYKMLSEGEKSFRDVICVKRMERTDNTTSVISFSGVFNNLYIEEKFMFDNHCIKTVTKCLSKENTAKYIIDRGYTIFGYSKDVMELMKKIESNNGNINKQMFLEHYSHNCMNILDYLKDIITVNSILKNDIIDFVTAKKNVSVIKIDDEDNPHVRYTTIKGISNVKNISKYIKNKQQGKSYWQAINE